MLWAVDPGTLLVKFIRSDVIQRSRRDIYRSRDALNRTDNGPYCSRKCQTSVMWTLPWTDPLLWVKCLVTEMLIVLFVPCHDVCTIKIHLG